MTAPTDLWILKEGVSQMDTPEIRYSHFGSHLEIILYISLFIDFLQECWRYDILKIVEFI